MAGGGGASQALVRHICAKSRPPGLLQVKCIMLQVLRGLQYLHRNFIIHRWAGIVAWGGGVTARLTQHQPAGE